MDASAPFRGPEDPFFGAINGAGERHLCCVNVTLRDRERRVAGGPQPDTHDSQRT
jgi:hypothetical protein